MSLWAVAAILIVVVLVAAFSSAYFTISELKPKPKLVADLSVSYYDWYPYDLDWHVSLSGVIHNYGDTGCFAVFEYTIEGASNWSESETIDLGWMPGEGGAFVVTRGFVGETMEGYHSPSADTLKLTSHFEYTKP